MLDALCEEREEGLVGEGGKIPESLGWWAWLNIALPDPTHAELWSAVLKKRKENTNMKLCC